MQWRDLDIVAELRTSVMLAHALAGGMWPEAYGRVFGRPDASRPLPHHGHMLDARRVFGADVRNHLSQWWLPQASSVGCPCIFSDHAAQGAAVALSPMDRASLPARGLVARVRNPLCTSLACEVLGQHERLRVAALCPEPSCCRPDR